MGGMNYHIPINFTDGVVWIVRIRRSNATSPPPALRDHIIRSEVATLHFLGKTKVPAPKIYDFAFEQPGNPVGVGYIFMEKLPGKSLHWPSATKAQKQVVLSQLADIFIELRSHPFDSLGCLDSPVGPRVGAFASESMTDFAGTQMKPLGPFSSLRDYYFASIRLTLDLILRDELYAGRAVDAYLIHRFLLDLVPAVCKSSEGGQKFFLKHADDKGDHILVDEKYNITGIIDWEWAHTFPMEVSFISPIAFLAVSAFYSGDNDLSEDEISFAQFLEEKKSPDLAQIVREGRIQHRFTFCCNYDLSDWSGFLGLFKGLRSIIGVDDGLEWADWKDIALIRYVQDEGLQDLLSREDAVGLSTTSAKS